MPYVLILGLALLCIVIAWFVLGPGVPALVLSAVAAVLIPVAVIVANAGREDGR